MKIHIVQKGDTLWEIAKKYGVDFEELKEVNSQLSSPDMIMPGMKIKIPSSSKPVKKKEEQINHPKKNQSHQPISMLKEDDKQQPKEPKSEMPTQTYPMMQLPELDQGIPTMPAPSHKAEVKKEVPKNDKVKQESPKKQEQAKPEQPKQEMPKIPLQPQQQMNNQPQFHPMAMPMPMVPMCCCQHVRPPCCHLHGMHQHKPHGCGCSPSSQQHMMPFEPHGQIPPMQMHNQMHNPNQHQAPMPEQTMMQQPMEYGPSIPMMDGNAPPMSGQQHGYHPMMMQDPNENINQNFNRSRQNSEQNLYEKGPEMYPSNMMNYYPQPPYQSVQQNHKQTKTNNDREE